MDNWCKRFQISLRAVSNLCKYEDKVIVTRDALFMDYLHQETQGIDPVNIVLADETCNYMEDPGRRTLESIGAKHVALKSTGFASERVTALVGTKPNGDKCLPLIIFKNDSIQ